MPALEHRKIVLIVDDNEAIRESVAECLEDEGVLAPTTPADVAQEVERAPPEAIEFPDEDRVDVATLRRLENLDQARPLVVGPAARRARRARRAGQACAPRRAARFGQRAGSDRPWRRGGTGRRECRKPRSRLPAARGRAVRRSAEQTLTGNPVCGWRDA